MSDTLSDEHTESGSEDGNEMTDGGTSTLNYDSYKDGDHRVPLLSEYQPKTALKHALRDWIPEFYRQSYADNNSSVPKSGDTANESNTSCKKLDTVVERRLSPRLNKNKGNIEREKKSAKRQKCKKSGKVVDNESVIKVYDLLTLTDLHYLPFSHGPRATQLLKEAHWLISNTGRIKGRDHKNGKLTQQVGHNWTSVIAIDILSVNEILLITFNNKLIQYQATGQIVFQN